MSIPHHPESLQPAAAQQAAYAQVLPDLLPQHVALLCASGIHPAIAAARQYMSVRADSGARLLRSRGFSRTQCEALPGLLLPVWGLDGATTEWTRKDFGREQSYLLAQYRPDTPVPDANGHTVRYVNAPKAPMRLDCNPRTEGLSDKGTPLWLTEGLRKGDALVSAGACAVAMLGVSMWRSLPDWSWLSPTLRGRDVYIAFDSDAVRKPQVQQQEEALAQFLANKGAQVWLCRLLEEAPGVKVGMDDFLGAGHTLEEALTAAQPWLGTAQAYEPSVEHDTRPVVRIDKNNIPLTVDAGQAAMMALPAPVIYQRAHTLVMVSREGTPPKWLRRAQGAPRIQMCEAPYLTEVASHSARWEKYDGRSKDWVPDLPPGWFATTLLARPQWAFPLLESVLCSPTLRPDASVINTPGYDVDTGLYYDPCGTVFPTLPDVVTPEDADAAVATLYEVVEDFPFPESQTHHRSAWLAAILTIACRYVIHGAVPLFGITATTRGSGKTLLADTIALIGHGYEASKWSQVHDEDEERKRLLVIAIEGDPLVCIDNVTRPLGSGVFAAAITAGVIEDRVLGATEKRKAPMNTVFLATGNNLQYIETLSRRVVPIAIDPKMERPEERKDFKNPNLRAWIQQHRPELLMCALTIVKGFMDAGCPDQGLTPFGGFEAWSNLIRQAIVWAGEPDPCKGREEIEQQNDPEYEDLGTLLEAWHACYPEENGVTIGKIINDITMSAVHVGPQTARNKWNELMDALGAYDRRYDGKTLNSKSLGRMLRGIQGRIIGEKRLVSDGIEHKTILWAVKST